MNQYRDIRYDTIYRAIATLDDNDSQKYTHILDANLRPYHCRRFRGKNHVHRHTVDSFSHKLTIKFLARPLQSGLQT